MHYSTILSLLSITTAIQATAISVRNANHVSMYDVNNCDDKKKYYKWKGTETCNCVVVDTKAASIYTDHEPLQHVIAFSDGNCRKTLGTLAANQCFDTANTFNGEAISSVMFWLPAVCDVEKVVLGIVGDVEKLIEIGAAIGA